jgi:hypothetical protein
MFECSNCLDDSAKKEGYGKCSLMFLKSDFAPNFCPFDRNTKAMWTNNNIEVASTTYINIAMVPCRHEWVSFLAHPPIEQCTKCDAVRREQH